MLAGLSFCEEAYMTLSKAAQTALKTEHLKGRHYSLLTKNTHSACRIVRNPHPKFLKVFLIHPVCNMCITYKDILCTCIARLPCLSMLAYSNMTSAWRLLARSGEDFQCLRCGKTYMHKGTLSRHVQYECGTVPRFTCRICGARNRRRYGLTNHLIMVHGVQKKQAELNITEKYIEKTEKFQ
ncbi:PR domain zinc finger protein 15-like [Schistocerca americana]|uniref:PR domain zinc finger protein 15-like n=1 Tax=Schistocerca americana TaxID=7009 RepID=UPI001F4FEC1E|nr:PR domain zinc finger protein 15-like [Schistocerca americana]